MAQQTTSTPRPMSVWASSAAPAAQPHGIRVRPLTKLVTLYGYKKDQEGHVIPTPGKLIYRGVNINEIVEEAYRNDRFVFEEVIWLLLFGSLPTQEQLDDFCEILAEHRALPEGFMDTMNAPSPNIMNKLQRCVLGLYSYDEHART